jgi:hypothetical protein
MADETTTAAAESQQTDATQTAAASDNAAATSKQDTATADAGTGNSGTLAKADAADTTDAGAEADKGDLQRFREQLAGGDAGLLKHLERHKSIESISKSFKESRNAAKTAGKPLSLSEKATEEEVKAYREAMGIPAEAAAYPVDFRQDYKASDADKEILGGFKEYMHAKNADPRAASAALEWYQDFAAAQQQELSANLAKVAKETQAALRTEWGGEYDGNLNAAQQLMTAQLGEEGFNEMMGLRLMDGSRLQDNQAFVKMMAQVGADYYGGNAIMTGDVETTAKTIDQKIADYREMQTKDPEKYRSPEVQDAVAALYAQKAKLDARKG